MSPRGWTAMAALGWVCLSAAALGARPGAAPAAPAVAGEIKVTTPKEGQEISFSEGSMFAIGTVPSEDYAMRCNGKIVDVWSEGAFIGYVPLKKVAFTLPDQRQADIALEFEAFKGKEKLTKVVHLVSPASPSHSKPQAESYNPAQVVESQQDHWIGMENEDASKDKVVLNLGKVIYMPAGARVAVGEKKTVLQEQKLLTQVRFTELIEDGTIWANAAFFKPSDGKPTVAAPPKDFAIDRSRQDATYKFSTPEPVPVVCEESVDRKTLRLRFVTEPPQVFVLPQEKVIWGFDAAYQKGQTLFTVKYTPAINPKQPLSGIRILLDPGHHPDTGALGPRGTEERAANLAMCQALAPLLKNEGAVVELSRENDPLELNDRQKRFHDAKPDLIVSIHHNSSPDNEDPRVRFGTQDFYLFPHSQPLAKSVHRALLPVVQSQDLGSVQRNLVVTRFPCAPSILVEVTYLIIPEEEKKVLTAEYRQQAAEAISDGIQKFLLGESGPKR